jgi:MoaA/NifB/PqqE/SkfB family radical SAM enzyme
MTKELLSLLNLSKLYYRNYLEKFPLDTLIFFVTSRCNFICKTCFYRKQGAASAHGSGELTLEEIRKISRSIGRLSKLFISGGEPFLRDDLADICEIFYLQNKIRNIYIPTNGYYTGKIFKYTYRILKKCPAGKVTVSFSLDGLEATHNKIKGIEDSFKATLESINKLHSLKKNFDNLYIEVITVVNNANLNEIPALLEFVKNNLEIDSHGPSPLRGIPNDKALLPPSHAQWLNCAKKIMEYHRFWYRKRYTNKIKAFFAINRAAYLHKIYAELLKNKKMPFRCPAGRTIGVLEPDGGVKLCELTEAVGNIRAANYDFKKIWLSETADSARNRIKNCACVHPCFINPGINMNPFHLVKSYLNF